MTDIEQIYKTYFNDVYFFMLKLSRDAHIAEEITSETFFKAMNSIDDFKGNCELRVWLCQIAKNCYYSYLRKNKRIDTAHGLKEETVNIDIEQTLLDAEASMTIHKALHQLDEPYKEVFTLRVFGELSFRRIAHLFGKTESWACVTYHRARKKIIDGLEDYI
ncbi:RNA polymerase sigma-70 factor (ECF subfamily) [Anaerotaenia torta]|uniref:RNA polymerase sigma factor n=1 Tax=Anaerotaenia torta TaxID=433293 RepID=UPI003D1984DF